MGLIANLIGYWANGESADETQARSDALDAQLEDLQRTREEERPEVYGTEDYRAAFAEHMNTQREQSRDIAGQLENSFNEGLGLQASKWGTFTKWAIAAAVLVAVLYLFGPALRKKFAS